MIRRAIRDLLVFVESLRPMWTIKFTHNGKECTLGTDKRGEMGPWITYSLLEARRRVNTMSEGLENVHIERYR